MKKEDVRHVEETSDISHCNDLLAKGAILLDGCYSRASHGEGDLSVHPNCLLGLPEIPAPLQVRIDTDPSDQAESRQA
jgi:hypothetical protein